MLVGLLAAGRRLRCLIIWCFQIAHTPTHNHGSKIRLAVISGFGKTEESLPDDEMLEHVRRGDLWPVARLVRRAASGGRRQGRQAKAVMSHA